MISRAWSRKSIAICLSVAVLSVYSMVVLAAPGQAGQSGELSVSGQVTVDGQPATNGRTIFAGSTITTGANSSAVVSLGKLGRVELLQNSSLKLSFTDAGLTGMLDAGRLKVSTNSGSSAVITTKDGSVVADTAQSNVFTVDLECGNTVVATQSGMAALRGSGTDQQIAAGSEASAGQAAPGTRCSRLTAPTNRGLSGGAFAALLLAAGGAIAGAIIASTTSGDDSSIGGGTVIVSPTK